MSTRGRLHALAAVALLSGPALVSAQAPPPAGFPGKAPPSPPVTIRSLSAEPMAIEPGGSTTLRWEVLNAYSLSIEPGPGTVGTRGSQLLSPAATTTYTLTATGGGVTATRAVTVNVAGTAPVATARAGAASSAPRPIPRLADGKPDLSGLYIAERDLRLVGSVTLVPGAESYRVETSANDLGAGVNCLPPGLPAATMLPFPFEIVQKTDVVAIMYEAYQLFRIVPVGRDHADYLAPAWMGHSVARWDGDTLVVDVRGFNDKTVVAGYRHTEDLRVVERFRRTAYETIEYEATVEDPNVFAAPLRYAGKLTLHPEWEIGEYVCNENNQDYDALFDD